MILAFGYSPAADLTDWNIEPPHAKTTSVPFAYQPAIWVWSSVEAENVSPYLKL